MQKASKRQRELSEDPGSQGSDDEGLCEVDASATKKPKISADEHITVHPIILKPRPATLKARKQMKQAYDELVQSPFFMGPTTTMDDMHDLLAVRLRTAVANLDTDRLQWRFEKPKNAPLKPLVDLDGFSAMMRAVAGKRGPDRIINLYLPPLKAEVGYMRNICST